MQNRHDDFLLDRMLEIRVGEEPESVMLPDILDTLLCNLCFPCWLGYIVPCIVRFLVGCQAYCSIESGLHVIPDQFAALSSD